MTILTFDLKKRATKMIDTLGIAKSKFADNVGIGRSTLYLWLSGKYNLNDKALKAIDKYLTKYGF